MMINGELFKSLQGFLAWAIVKSAVEGILLLSLHIPAWFPYSVGMALGLLGQKPGCMGSRTGPEHSYPTSQLQNSGSFHSVFNLFMWVCMLY